MSQVAYLPAGKREQTKLQNRAAILDAAREVFGELGYEAATVRDIIRRTGLAAGTFYNYYRSKEEVFAALAEEGARKFQPILKAERVKARDFETFVRGAIRAYYRFLADEHANWIARRPPEEPHPHLRSETPEGQAVFAEVRAAIVEESRRGGPAGDPDYLAAACIAIAREVGEKMLQRRPIDTEGAAEFAMAMILGGARSLPGAKS
ncbi:TetR/AcrR family transcriptional regulator [Phenylobacterium sp.]|jgi:AcrR family transcriptional regulator|uniref:TetR/AcrR family transcriptional regulator n=1 Tax=Phenylobacterium sp. TaxID=1871053 RepID=UPI002E37CB21|nr:TetR/AcrR family transcriptional regulator [Phenylobacterium sp.]HEX2559311.1 TetR/AcrR family transcriptional regulator [Phenylobacterium sp.]